MERKLLLVLVSVILLAGCRYLPLPAKSDGIVSGHNAVCAQLKRKIIFYRNDPNMNIEWNSPTRRALLMQEYKNYNCDASDQVATSS